MPIYEFHCNQCGRDSELLIRSMDWKGSQCPKCGSKRLEKKLSVFAAGGSGDGESEPACTGNPSACGRCALD